MWFWQDLFFNIVCLLPFVMYLSSPAFSLVLMEFKIAWVTSWQHPLLLSKRFQSSSSLSSHLLHWQRLCLLSKRVVGINLYRSFQLGFFLFPFCFFQQCLILIFFSFIVFNQNSTNLQHSLSNSIRLKVLDSLQIRLLVDSTRTCRSYAVTTRALAV